MSEASLFDVPSTLKPWQRPAEGQERQEQGIRAAVRHADPTWLGDALSVVHYLARTRRDLTTDDVWGLLGNRVPAEPRALGGVMRRAARKGWIRVSDRWRLSDRAENHRRPIRVWDSVLHR
jgi:hypothetical protein